MSRNTTIVRRGLLLGLLALLLGAAAFVPPAHAQEEESVREAEHEAEAVHGNTSETVFKWLNFFLVFGVGGYLAAPYLRRWAAGQRKVIQDQIAEGHRQHEEAQKKLAQIEARLDGLENEIAALRQEAKINAEAEQQRIRKGARREAERILSTTTAEIESAGRAARLELRAYAAHLAVSLAEQRLRQQLTPQLHAALFDASLQELARRPGAEGVTP